MNFSKLKHCPHCNQDLLIDQFTSSRAKTCIPCHRIVQLEQRQAMTERSLARTKIIKRKTVTIISLKQLHKQTQTVVNAYVRERDKDLPCISCGKFTKLEAGHYWNMGNNRALRYNLDNLNGQCVPCNRWGHGNLLEYRINLVKKIGADRVQWLDDHHKDNFKWTREELELKRAEIKNLMKLLKGDLWN